MHYTTQTRIALLMSGWTIENKRALYAKMQSKGIMQGGILSTNAENIELFNYLMKGV